MGDDGDQDVLDRTWFKTEKIANVPKVVVFLRFFRLDGDQGYSTHLSSVLEHTGAHEFEANN